MCKHKLSKRNKLKQRLRQKRKRKVLKHTLKQKLLCFIFFYSPQSNLSQFNEIVISNLKLKGLGSEKVLIK